MRFRPHNHRILYGTCMLTPLLQRLPAPARPSLLPALLFVSLIALAHLWAVSGRTAGVTAAISAGYDAGVLCPVFMVAGIRLATGPDAHSRYGAGAAAGHGGAAHVADKPAVTAESPVGILSAGRGGG